MTELMDSEDLVIACEISESQNEQTNWHLTEQTPLGTTPKTSFPKKNNCYKGLV